MEFDGIKNLVFDFGGVLYEINTHLSLNGFLDGSSNKSMDRTAFINDETFILFEKGLISAEVFRDRIRVLVNANLTDNEIDRIWNLTLIKPYIQSNELMTGLKDKYNLALLSNTNEIHHNYFKNQVKDLFNIFDFLVFSYKTGHRKPESEIYQYLIESTGFLPEETVFLDDLPENIEMAKSLRFKTYLVKDQNSLWEIFHTV
jgi:putative hydrolase of the HAD superfamily